MENKRRIIIAVLLVISIGNYSRLTGNENIRTIRFLSIFVIGALSALLLNEFSPSLVDKTLSVPWLGVLTSHLATATFRVS